MALGKTLMDAVTSKTGMSRYAMSKRLHVHDGFISRVYNGKDPIPPALAARLALLAGIDARTAALEALISQEKDADIKTELATALGVTVVTDDAPAPPGTGGLKV